MTAGPTYEPIDPVRFIGNHSSGKMGFAIAVALAESGALVKLIAGPVHIAISHPNIQRIDVKTADEMYSACVELFPACRGAILSAAVADYRPEHVSSTKIKKTAQAGDEITLKLVKNKDILAALGNIKTKKQLLVGFSLETNNEMEYAADKLKRKNCDMIVMNSLQDEGAGFAVDTNKITILNADGSQVSYPKKRKDEVARDIVEYIISTYF